MDVRISLANLAVLVHRISTPTQLAVPFGIVSPKNFAAGKMRVQALGGAAELTRSGVSYFSKNFGAHSFELDPTTNNTDARFMVDERQVEGIFELFKKPQPLLLEVDPTREVFEELLKEYSFGPLLARQDLDGASVAYWKSVVQPLPDDGKGTSARAQEGLVTRRMFNLFYLSLGNDTLLKLQIREVFVLLTRYDLESTNGGRQKGKTYQGHEIADNIWAY